MTITQPTPSLPSSLQKYPDLDSWLRLNPDETVTVFTGKVEIGQGIRTAVAQIAAEELEVALERVRVAVTETRGAPDEGTTAGSNSLETSGSAVRLAAAEARHVLLHLAAEHLEAPVEQLTVYDGVITDPASGQQVSYWALQGGRPFGEKVTGRVRPKPAGSYTTVGQPVPRLDLPAKVAGQPAFVHDMALPDMVHGRIVRPPNPGAKLLSLDEAGVQALPGVLAVVQDGNFVGVVAEREEQAVLAREKLQVGASWQPGPPLPSQAEVYEHLQHGPGQNFLVVEGTPVDGPIPPIDPPVQAAQTLSATYYRPFQMHAALGPSAALAHWTEAGLTVWTHSQGIYALRGSLAEVLGLAESQIHLVHVEGAGCYGHNGADDVALDAALLARALPGRPVLLKWMRADEHAWEPYSTAMVIQNQASLDANGQIIDWNHDVHSYTHTGRPRPWNGKASGLLAAQHLAQPLPPPTPRPVMAYHVGIHRNADPLYAFPRRRVVKHFVPDNPLRVSAMRSLGAYANVFAIESFMDELALAAGSDPITFRLRHLQDERAKAVIEAAAERAGWQPGQPATGAGQGRGRGLGFAQYKNQKCYAAVIVEAQVDTTTGQIRLERAVIAADAGQIVNPDGLANQLEGGVVQAASWTLKEAVRFDQAGVLSQDWQSYPILTFTEAPEIETVLLDRPDQPWLGAGEATHGPTPAAIANAVFEAVGVRLREIPFTPERVLAALGEKRKV